MTGPEFISEAGEEEREQGFWNTLVESAGDFASALGNFIDGLGSAVSDDFPFLLSVAGGLALLLLWGVLHRTHKFPWVFKARVSWVCDGDSIWVRRWYGRRVKLRLLGIDAPETEQTYGDESQKVLEELVGGRVVLVRAVERDIFGRYVASVRVGSVDAGLSMIEAGAAWPYFRYLSKLPKEDVERIREAWREAKAAGRGLWRERNPEAPWDWRERHRSWWSRLLYWVRRLFYGERKRL